MAKKIGILVGSLRAKSFSKQLAEVLISLAPKDIALEIIDISALPIYNQDFDDQGNPPASYATFREKASSMEGFIFITPEYNRSVPAVIKNALDVGSRPYGQSVWDGKPGAVFSSSPGSLGGFGANHHLRQSMVFLNIPLMQQPEIYISQVNKQFDEQGNIEPKCKELLEKGLKGYISFFNNFKK
jgi:chromate reductase